ncbi:hypothetical protein [Falsiroseomonas sp.]|uniref:hypothetical protein n=1 Tax=Falsiroseomonas sp. TaxID=2870721 RepID=UPI0035637C3D
MRDPQAPPGAPGWAAALGQRLGFLLRDEPGALPRIEAALRSCAVIPGGWDGVAARYPLTCLDLLEAAAADHPALHDARAELLALAGLARAALAGDRAAAHDLGRRELPAMELPGAASFAARVPGRAAWFAAVLAEVPSEQGPAVVMLANDLAVTGADAPLRALEAAALAAQPGRGQ